MKINFKGTPKQLELIAAVGSKEKLKSQAAQEAFAAYIGPIVQQVLQQVGTAQMIYTDDPYNEDDSPTYPLDLYYGEGENFVQTWSQQMAGGIPTTEVGNIREIKISTYRLDGAVSFNKKYARRCRLEVISKAVERLTQEVLVKIEKNAWATLLKALAEASTGGSRHTILANTQNVFGVDDVSRLITLVKRFNTSWARGTTNSSMGLTDLFVSPEIKGQIRGFAYNPMNTVGSQSTGPVPLPNNVREQIFRAAGTEEIYGIGITDLVELGTSRKYNNLFASFAAGLGSSFSSADFSGSGDEVVIGLDLSAGRDAFVRPIETQSGNPSSFQVLPDDQWVARSDKAGFYGWLQEGRLCLDSKACVGLIV